VKNIFARSHTEHHWRCSHVLKLLSHSRSGRSGIKMWLVEFQIQRHHWMKNFQATLYVQATSRSHLLDLLLQAVFVLRLTWTSNLHKQAWWPRKADLMQPLSRKWGIHGLQIWTQDLENVCDAQFMWPSGLDFSSILGQKCMSYVCYCKVAACN